MFDEQLIKNLSREINKYLMQAPRQFPSGPFPHIFCDDGTEISVQAGKYLHSLPKDDEGPWTHVEVYLESPKFLQITSSEIASYTPIDDLAIEILMHSRKSLSFKSGNLLL